MLRTPAPSPTIPMRLLTVATAFLALFALPAAQAALTPFTAEYTVRYHGVPATAQASLQRTGENWIYVMSIGNMVASMNQATVFRDTGRAFVLLGGSDRVQYPGNRKAVTTRYDWKAGQVRWTGDAKPSRAGPIPLHPGDVDALVMQLALVRDHSLERAMNYRVVENARARPAQFRRSGTDQLTIGSRAVTATRYTQTQGNKSTTIWVAAGVPAPVQVSQREGSRETARLTMTAWR